ncbi:BatD family protein [Flavobacteriaceae bacterium F08102]|nr:BatD family protein [Flavobacteriaceae bacterium F08102]
MMLTVFSSMVAQEASFKTEVSKTRMGINERIRVVYSMNRQGADNFNIPNLEDFRIVAGPMMGQSFSDFNGKTSFTVSYTYTMQPLKKGKLKIPVATIEYKGKTLKSSNVEVTVTDAIEIPKDPYDPNYIASQNIHLVAEISNTNPYVGESIYVVYKLYVDVNNVDMRNPREIESPSFNGFWNQNIDIQRWEPKSGTYQGKNYRYAVVKKAVLIPQKSGNLTIEPMTMEIQAGVPIGKRDLWGNLIKRSVELNVTTGKRIINVKPLPAKNKPADFNGAVGDFSFAISSDKEELKADEAAQISVKLSGKGNLKLIELPDITTPEGLEKYEPEYKENLSITSSGFKGSIEKTYTVVPQYRGKYKIPKVSFSYFSLPDNDYKTIVSDELILNAPEGKSSGAGTTVVSSVKRDVIGQAKDIRFISTNTSLNPVRSASKFYGSTLFYGLLLLPLVAIPLGMLIGKQQRKRAGDIVGNKRRAADRLAKKYLSEAKKQLGKKEGFYIALEKALHNYLKASLQVETSEISKEKIAELLQARSVDDELITTFIKVLDDCDYARYTPTTNVMMEKEYYNAKEILAKIDKQLS